VNPAVIFEDEKLVVVDKPGGVVVHKTRGAPPGKPLLQQVRDMTAAHVYPVHRLDRGTSGLVIFAKDPATASLLGQAMMEGVVKKGYLALVRGWVDREGFIDYPLTAGEKDDRIKEAQTQYQCLRHAILEKPIGRYDTARYSLVKVQPLTGRWRQIRRHFSHLRHPIIGDVKHGDRHHNHFFRREWDIKYLCLSAVALQFEHPHTGNILMLATKPGTALRTAMSKLMIDV
jgi:tRNA pseudouridine65 synthase